MKKVLTWIGIIIGSVFLVGVLAGIIIPNYDAYQKRAESDRNGSASVAVKIPIVTEEEYISSTKEVVRKKGANGIYYKEIFKNPTKFIDTRLNIVGKIMEIKENDGQTFIQMFVSDDLDSVIVHYKGNTSFYKDDLIRVYGEGVGTMEGQNRMGATMTWPVIQAKYIKKFK